MSIRLLSYADLDIKKGLDGRVTIWRKTKDDSLKFPKPIDIGYGQKRWKESEIDEWIETRAAM